MLFFIKKKQKKNLKDIIRLNVQCVRSSKEDEAAAVNMIKFSVFNYLLHKTNPPNMDLLPFQKKFAHVSTPNHC